MESMPSSFYRCFCGMPGAWRRRGCPWHDREAGGYRSQLAIHAPLALSAEPRCSRCGRAFQAGETYYDKGGVLSCFPCVLRSPLLSAPSAAAPPGASQDDGGVPSS